jgi:hypothetical protein
MQNKKESEKYLRKVRQWHKLKLNNYLNNNSFCKGNFNLLIITGNNNKILSFWEDRNSRSLSNWLLKEEKQAKQVLKNQIYTASEMRLTKLEVSEEHLNKESLSSKLNNRMMKWMRLWEECSGKVRL